MSVTQSLTGVTIARPRVSTRALVLIVAVLGLTAGFLATGDDASMHARQAAGPELTHLLQMMAGLKLALALGAAVLIDWRLRQPAGPMAAAGYLVALGLMSAGPGLVWGMAHVMLGAGLLHAGLLTLIVLSCKDDGMWSRMRRVTSRAR